MKLCDRRFIQQWCDRIVLPNYIVFFVLENNFAVSIIMWAQNNNNNNNKQICIAP